jgi:hypothetical protein
MKGASAALAALVVAWFGNSTLAQAPTGKVTVVTSFSKDVTDPFKKAFEKAHPGATLEVQNRNTNAGVKFVEETKANNQVDLFWASAPDAFEVMKGKGLLQKYQTKATGIPEKIGAFPINEPQGFYFGFAASAGPSHQPAARIARSHFISEGFGSLQGRNGNLFKETITGRKRSRSQRAF